MKETAILLGVLLLGGSARADTSTDTRGEVLSGIARCGAIADDRAWLSCIYGAAQPMRSQLGLPPAPAFQTSLVPARPAASPRPVASAPLATEPKESGGILSFLLGGDSVVSGMKLASYRFDASGFFDVTLANGQVWEQRDGPLAHWRGPASQYAASIRKGAAGSFNLTIGGENILYKVRRIR